MKLILAIINNSDVRDLSDAMMKGGFSLTKIGSTGGILKAGMTTMISAVRNEMVSSALDIISASTHSRKYESNAPVVEESYSCKNIPGEIVVGGATVFVLNIEESFKF